MFFYDVFLQYKSLCNVKVKKLDYDKYPKHIGINLKMYAWKIVAIYVSIFFQFFSRFE